ncbi:MAG: transglycosylase domain-containing protein, partial [Eubacteriales bacterium]|nr:transglycosylase domain-containing protein [Eubacteriales bacterium]
MPKNEITTVFSDINGNNVEGFKNSFAQYSELPDNLKNAVVAVEDKRFYKHKGVDTIRIFGAIRNNLKGGSLEGASTITQQLVKNTHLTQEKSIKRKLNEIKIAKQLEKEYSKDDILTSYLNVSYFGGGLYGVKSAAKGIFNKNLSSLTLSECAVLAGILKNPSKYSPVASVENATKRRNVVLSLMKNQNLITDAEYNSAKNEKISVDLNAIYSNTQSYVESASFEAAGILNVSVGSVLSGGYKIETFLNPDYQACLTEVLGNPNFYVLNKNGVRADGLSIIVDNKNMGVSAYFSTKKRNIYDFYRPFGSTAKPVVIYAPALSKNVVSPATPVLDMKTDFNGYMPKNYNEHYLGWTDVRAAIMTSSNVVAVKTYNALGFKNVQSFANSVGINISD